MPAHRTPRGPADPGRRDRIIDAVLDIISERGLIGVSHRTVAQQAGVPLGSTTYYFDSLDDLLAGALQKVIDDYEEELRARVEQLAGVSGRPLVRALTDMIFEYLGDRERTQAEYALCLAAMDRPSLRPLAARYTQISIETLCALMPRAHAVALEAALDGMLIRGLCSPEPLDRKEVESALAAIVTEQHVGSHR